MPAIPQLRSPGNDCSVARRLNGNATHTVGRSAGSLSVELGYAEENHRGKLR